MNTTLLIMAAGIGSRFQGGIKQLEPVGIKNEIIMDYSIHDAIQAGFNKIVFVIRKDIEAVFREQIGKRIEAICSSLNIEIIYVYQDIHLVPDRVSIPKGRTKPWGTAHAVLAAKEVIHEPFMVINSDDYYGKEAFCKIHDWLLLDHADSVISMAGFVLKNTLSENGGVNRSICRLSEDKTHIIDVVEHFNIIKTKEGAEANGVKLNPESFVSMNIWGFPAKKDHNPAFMTILEEQFNVFFENTVLDNPLEAEYLLPNLIGRLLRKHIYTADLLTTTDKWFGVTYMEDKDIVVNNFKELIMKGVYKEDLYSDL